MYRRSLQPRWREITASVLVIAVLGSSAGILTGNHAPSDDAYPHRPPPEYLGDIDLVGPDRGSARVLSMDDNRIQMRL